MNATVVTVLWPFKTAATRAIFYLQWQWKFQELIALPSRVQISMCSLLCAGSATTSEKLQKNEKIWIFWLLLYRHTVWTGCIFSARWQRFNFSKSHWSREWKNCPCSRSLKQRCKVHLHNQSAEDHGKECHPFWLRLRCHSNSNARMSASVIINWMAWTLILIVITVVFEKNILWFSADCTASLYSKDYR